MIALKQRFEHFALGLFTSSTQSVQHKYRGYKSAGFYMKKGSKVFAVATRIQRFG